MCILSTCTLAVRALEGCRGIEQANFFNSFPFLKYPGITYQPLTSCRLIPEYIKKGRELKKSVCSILQQPSSALTAKNTGAKNAHNSSNLTAKIGKCMKTIIPDLCTCERYNSGNSCSSTYIYQLLKGMVLNVVLKPCLFGLSVSCNLNLHL